MDLTQGTEQEKTARSKKMMLWFGIISMVMMFAGLTSAYVVSSERQDWLNDFTLPASFIWSTLAIVTSSITLFIAKKQLRVNNRKGATYSLLATLVLGVIFVGLQLQGFEDIINLGFYFTGSESSITTSFIYVLVLAHLAHIAAGLIVLLVLIYNHFKQRYTAEQMLGFELGATFWHFVDVLWLYLFVFLYFF
ncbi:cytochrome c oxidase subunit 3 [Croceibacter atlanticus]|jgi:cytochrome c oxidase subunit 3|uniref:cytochrome c oxidase subunit 3 n=1 Tax=Croceibacter atlanticus TaxID=313588 RepID=UPI002E0D646E|nr:cytochrome c oxidase subunit 3 [Croceibacter atlanticus]